MFKTIMGCNKVSYNQHITLILVVFTFLLACVITSGQSLCNGQMCIDGNCIQKNENTSECQCPTSYPQCVKEAGSNCTTVTDYCLNNSTCSFTTEFTCQCAAGFTGRRCENILCDNSYCNNEGECIENSTGSKSCICNACYTDSRCSQAVDACLILPLKLPCANETGSCRTGCRNGVLDQYCQCNIGWTGPTCEYDTDECNPTAGKPPCSIHGECVNTPGSYYCNCNTGFEGPDCANDIDECTLNPCDPVNSVGCNNTIGSYECICKPGYDGQKCTQPTCAKDELCNGNGQCQTNSTHWFCNCTQFYDGVQCEEEGPCVSTPCLHGTCSQSRVNGTLLHTCTCDPGWTNTSTCADNIDECSGNNTAVCMNGGQCVDTEGSFMCNCTPAWTGHNCTEDVNECANTPCGPGICTNLEGNYSCDCQGTGFRGQYCSLDIDECAADSTLCLNSGTCVDTEGSYSCQCAKGWTGANCDIRDYCATDCVIANTVNGNSCKNLAKGANCTCAPGYLDTNCGVMSTCIPNPCENGGECTPSFTPGSIDGNRTASDLLTTCSCSADFTGDNCETPLERLTGDPNLAVYIAVPLVVAFALAAIIGVIICFVMAKKKRATRGRYSPSRNETLGPNLPMSGMLKPPPEERLI